MKRKQKKKGYWPVQKLHSLCQREKAQCQVGAISYSHDPCLKKTLMIPKNWIS